MYARTYEYTSTNRFKNVPKNTGLHLRSDAHPRGCANGPRSRPQAQDFTKKFYLRMPGTYPCPLSEALWGQGPGCPEESQFRNLGMSSLHPTSAIRPMPPFAPQQLGG